MTLHHPGPLRAALALALLALGARAQPMVVDAGQTARFAAAAGATGYAWRLNGAVQAETGARFAFPTMRKEVGTHWVSVETHGPGGVRSNQNWPVRVRIALPDSGANYYVATNGLDMHPGTLDQPFLTLERARDAVRSNGLPAGGVSVWVRGGLYRRTNTFALGVADSGREDAPVIYRAFSNERPVFTTARALPARSFAPLDPALGPRVRPGVVVSDIVELDLVAQQVANRGPFPAEFLRCPIFNAHRTGADGGLCELFFHGQRQHLSRYPNRHPTDRWRTPYLKMNGVIHKTATSVGGVSIGGQFAYDPADAAAIVRWQQAAAESNLWLQGFWRVPWECEGERVLALDPAGHAITLARGASPGATGLGNKYAKDKAVGSKNEPFWALNLLEEIDVPGEWSVDFARKKLYLLPPGPLTDGAVELTDFAGSLISVSGACHLAFSGLTLERHLARGITCSGATNVLVQGCTFRNLGGYAVDLDQGRGCGVVSCDLSALAAGGLLVRGGREQAPRISNDHYVVNNDIRDFAQVVPVYAAGIDAGFGGMGGGGGGGGHEVCVGARIAHNHVQGTPHGGILRGSFGKVIEYNRVEAYCMISGDLGGLYSYQRAEQGGEEIVRYNLFSAPTNHLYPTYLNPGPTGGNGLQVDGTCVGDAFYGNLARVRRTAFAVHDGTGSSWANNVAIQSGGSYAFGGTAALFAGNVAALGATGLPASVTGANRAYATDPGFLDGQANDFRLRPDARVYADLPAFREIPFELFGLYADEVRRRVPALRPVFRQANAPVRVAGDRVTLAADVIFPWLVPDAVLRVYWGPRDGGTSPAAWAQMRELGPRTRGAAEVTVTGVPPRATCFYRFQMVNGAGAVWAERSARFVRP